MPHPLLAELIPTPQECRFTEQTFLVGGSLRLQLPMGSAAADLRSAALLATVLATVGGRTLQPQQTTRYVGWHVLQVGDGGEYTVPSERIPERRESYYLRIDETGILLAARDSVGLFYAVQTLTQIVRLRRQGGHRIPAVEIRDWPALEHRGVMIDVGRQVERVDWLVELIEQMAAYKKNMFVLYFEDKFRWKRHPGLSHPTGYTHKDLQRLARVAEANHMEFVPALASLGHCEGILQHQEIAHLREDGAIYQLSLRHSGTRTLLSELYAEILPLYRGRFFHVNCDESPLLAGPPGSPQSYLKESLRLFTRHLVFLRDLLARHGKQMMIWGDMLLHYPQIMDSLPHDIIVVDWDYAPMRKRKREAPALLRRHGFPVIVAPAAVRSAQVCIPHASQLEDNIPHFIRAGVKAGACGEMTTLWELFASNSLVAMPGLITSAQYAWNPDAVPPTRIARTVAAHRYGPEAAADVVTGMRGLSSHAFQQRMKRESDTELGRRQRSYHVDSHELAVSDPVVHLTYRRNRWAEGIRTQMTAGVVALQSASSAARWHREELSSFRFAGLQQLFMADKRCAVNEAGSHIVAAERLRRVGRLLRAAKQLEAAGSALSRLTEQSDHLVRGTPAMWASTKPAGSQSLAEIFMDRLVLARHATRLHAAAVAKAGERLRRGQNADVSHLLGGGLVLFAELSNPSPSLYDIFRADIFGTDQTGKWCRISSKNWFVLNGQTYVGAWALAGGGLPERLRVVVRRTHIDPKAFPLASRLRFRALRTLTPAEIIAGAPAADYDLLDWRLISVPTWNYQQVRSTGWTLEFARQRAPAPLQPRR